MVKTKGKNMRISNVNFRKIISLFLAFSLFAFLTENAVCEQPKKREYWPTSGWKTSTPEMQGMDSVKLLIAEEFIQNRLPDALSLLVVKNGYLVFEKYYSYGSRERYAVVHSVTKSVTSALIGIALEKGYLNSVDQKIIEFFPEYITDELDPRKKEISLKHLLTMSAGFKWNDWGPVMYDWYYSADWGKFAIQLLQENNPGDVFNYNSSTSHLLSIILSKSTKVSTLDFANQNLFEPLGIQNKYWNKDPQGFYIGGFGLCLSARDLAKIGFLYLNNGFWNGRSIVPETWVKESTRQHMYAFYAYGPLGYGYQWWIKEVDGCHSYRAIGRRGQYIVVVPKLDMVIVVTSKTEQPHPPTARHYSPLFDLVASSVKRERPPKKLLKAVELPPDVKAFITNFNQAWSDEDIAKVSDFISDNFLYYGLTKNSLLEMFTISASYLSESKLILTGFELQGNIAKIEGVRKDKYFEIPLIGGSMLIKENGQWKLYGNQVPK
jgi:CubicO group peptidase (beta-lactamase class C family)